MTQEKPLKSLKAHVQNESMTERLLNFELEITGLICLLAIGSWWAGSPLATRCLLLSYKIGPDAYDKGNDDIYFIGFWVVAFTFLRAFFIKYIFHPFARLTGITPFDKRQRFAEQGFMFTYYAVFWIWGMYLMYHSPYWFNTSYFWIDYPHIMMKRDIKSYYLMQTAFFIQQLYALHVEKRRKDHFAMVTHHVITITLLVSSYYTNFTRIGNAVLCSMDLSDLLLSLAKILKYLDFSTLCDMTFAAFAIAWPITRHGFFTVIIWATAFEPHKYLDMKWEPEKGKYFTPSTQKMYLTLFLLLDCIMIYWFSMIVKVVYRVIQGKGAEDTRSDDEDEEEIQREKSKEKKKLQ
ncbi:longevity-assurance protein [Lichtheimia corymbifera JMRC:FSU:9682]|uniref:Longevity-assurance protein n=1 Tax=Lichtheimia corymbifera JMRC:FSU:9682 TaxID=1263082 RepID=A0A068RZU2_9FUNG|nr:longevity-assurance protein [Lichtheimia corymbifera JMRC:FSU:9682]